MASKPSAAAGLGDAAHKRAEITRAHVASIIESSDDAIISKDLEGIVTSWNAGAECIFGYSATEMIGRPVTLLIPPENPDEESKCIARIKGGERIEHYETCCVRKDGRRIDVSLTVLPIKDEAGKIIGASKIARDISERKHAVEQLRESELRFRQLAENIHEVFFLLEPANAKILYISPTYEEIWGRSCESLYAEPQSWMDSIHPDDLETVRRGNEERDEIGRFEYEYRIVRPDASMRWIHARGFPILGDAGKVYRVAGVAEDITDHKLAEDSLRKSENFKDAIIKSALDGLVTIDHQGKIVEFNPAAARMFGFTREEALGKRMAELIIPPHLRDAHHRGFARYHATGEGPILGKRLEFTAMRADGTEFPVELAVTSIGSRAAPMFTGYIRDISERKLADQEIRRGRRELVDFIENATIGMHWVSQDGTILWANQTEMTMLGYAPDEYIGHNITEFHTDADVINNLLQRLKRHETLRDIGATLRCKDGSFRYVQIDSNVLWEDGQFVHSRCFTRDITERKLAEQALQDSEQRLRSALVERERLSRDLHDGIVQEIYAIGLGLEEAQVLVAEHANSAKRKISDAIAGLNEVIREVRKHIIGLEPQHLTGPQFRAELTALAKTMRNAHSLRFRFEIDAMAVSRLSDDAAPHVLNITREAISNSLRHSEGRNGLVSLQPHHDGVRLIVEDDGSGYDLQQARVRGQGLRNIEARADQLAAKLDIHSGTGHGTRIVLDIPAEHANAAP